MQELVIDARTDTPLVTTTSVPAEKSQTGEAVSIERVFPLPSVKDEMSAQEFGESILMWMESLRKFAAGKAALTVLDEDGEPVWNKVKPDAENGLIDPFCKKPVTWSTVAEYIRRSLSLDHNRVMRELAMERAGLSQSSSNSGRGKRLPTSRI